MFVSLQTDYSINVKSTTTMEDLSNIQNLIYVIRSQRVMLDFDLAMLYEVETRSLNEILSHHDL